MNIFKILALLFLFFISDFLNAAPIKKGDIIYATNFNLESGRSEWSKLSNARWLKEGVGESTCLVVKGEGMMKTSINLAPYKGMTLTFSCQLKAEGVTKPDKSYNGVKFMLNFKSYSKDIWKNEANKYGTFGWEENSFSIIIPNDVSVGDLYLGLQGSSGKVCYDRILVVVSHLPPVALKTKNKVYSEFKETLLRGVMANGAFREEDLRTLGENWNANLIRWQLTMSQHEKKSIGDNLESYDRWLNKKLDELDKALVVSKKYGIKVVIDLHSAPGDRDSNGEINMFHEKKYNDHFIKIWKRIAQRFNGNPAIWAYDLVNEPQQYKPSPASMGCMETQVRVAQAIRKIDSKTVIIIETNGSDSPLTFKTFTPINISNVIYSVHMYLPFEFTHQGVGNNRSEIVYPGLINGTHYDINALKDILKPVRDFQLSNNISIYVGEFSAARWAPGAAQYLDDCIEIFEEYGWNWTYHAFRESYVWSVEHENSFSQGIPKLSKQDTDRKKVLLKAFAKNKRP